MSYPNYKLQVFPFEITPIESNTLSLLCTPGRILPRLSTAPLAFLMASMLMNITMLKQPSYSLDLALCDFLFFLKFKEVIKGNLFFPDVEAIKRNMMIVLQRIHGEYLQECMGVLQRRMGKC